VEVAQCPRTERQSSLVGLECCGAFFTTADILSLTASSCPHFRAIHDRGVDEGLNHEQSDLVGDCCMTAVASSAPIGCLHLCERLCVCAMIHLPGTLRPGTLSAHLVNGDAAQCPGVQAVLPARCKILP
jgi:hypothetical protein